MVSYIGMYPYKTDSDNWQHLPPTYSTDSLHSPCNQCWCTTPSWLSTAAAADHPNKMAPFLLARGMDGRLARHIQSPTYVDPRTGDAAQDVHITPGYGPWKQTFIRSTTDWTQHGDLPTAQDRGRWRQLVETATLQPGDGFTHDDDDDDVLCAYVVLWEIGEVRWGACCVMCMSSECWLL